MVAQSQTQSTFSGASSSPLAWNELLLACPQEQEEIGKQSHIAHSLDHPSAAELRGLWRQYALWLRLFCTLSVTAAVVLQECHLFCCIGSRTAWPHHPGSNWLPSDLKCGGFVWTPLAVEWRALTVICSEGDFEPHVSPENVFTSVMAAVICWSLNQPPEMRVFRLLSVRPKDASHRGSSSSKSLFSDDWGVQLPSVTLSCSSNKRNRTLWL